MNLYAEGNWTGYIVATAAEAVGVPTNCEDSNPDSGPNAHGGVHLVPPYFTT